jgi:hypothetical protein
MKSFDHACSIKSSGFWVLDTSQVMEDVMNRQSASCTSSSAVLAFGCLLIGCSSQVPSGSSEPIDSQESPIVFQDSWSDTGRFTVYKSLDGVIRVEVTGAFGKDDPIAVGQKLGNSLVSNYLALRPDVKSPPEILVELDKVIPSLVHPSAPQPPASITKDQTAFNNTVCVNFWERCGVWQPLQCLFTTSTWAITTGDSYNSGDRSYVWNQSNEITKHTIGSCCAEGTLQPHTWGYDWWFGSFIVNFHTSIYNPYNHPGEMGITIHKFVAQPC